MASEESRLRISHANDVTEVSFVDRNILDEANIQSIRDQISSIVASQERPKLLINFQNVDHLSSAALGALIRIRSEILEKEGELRLAEIDSQIYDVFVITQLHTLFQIHQSADEARASF
ncbi:MAG: STAS domain-containing protein [Phycisphaeraceae bacterium]|nr:STAS domain-containing protein [Phycisphaerales bacterium]MCB9859106.1 STAS domain-containing protein [Phycisphaeraceae bacterium]